MELFARLVFIDDVLLLVGIVAVVGVWVVVFELPQMPEDDFKTLELYLDGR